MMTELEAEVGLGIFKKKISLQEVRISWTDIVNGKRTKMETDLDEFLNTIDTRISKLEKRDVK